MAAATGISPAPAGRSFFQTRVPPLARDQPRACGEKGSSVLKEGQGGGSAPRLRGEVRKLELVDGRYGISPAPAGRRWPGESRTSTAWDQPRACGEKRVGCEVHRQGRGSAPRLRGEGRWPSLRPVSVRISPAPAGRSCVRLFNGFFQWDQPRACGEKRRAVPQHLRRGGSAPRLRGEGWLFDRAAVVSGISPAPAGRRRQGTREPALPGDQPRACGEKGGRHWLTGRRRGSAPRLRGEGTPAGAAPGHSGISPAPAGRRSCLRDAPAKAWDQPRACGEKLGWLRLSFAYRGSAPRLRGEVALSASATRRAGISPAPAGRRSSIIANVRLR